MTRAAFIFICAKKINFLFHIQSRTFFACAQSHVYPSLHPKSHICCLGLKPHFSFCTQSCMFLFCIEGHVYLLLRPKPCISCLSVKLHFSFCIQSYIFFTYSHVYLLFHLELHNPFYAKSYTFLFHAKTVFVFFCTQCRTSLICVHRLCISFLPRAALFFSVAKVHLPFY